MTALAVVIVAYESASHLPETLAAPHRQREQHGGGEQPQQRVALEQTPLAHELEHEHEQPGGDDDREDLQARDVHQIPWSATTGDGSPALTVGRARNSPTNTASSTLIM